jgi:MSHA biogenesis protein MshP
MRTGVIVRLPGGLQQGFGLVSAIFLVVVLSALGAAMASLSGMQHTGAAIDVLEVRAYHAARAGLEWGLYQSLGAQPPTCPVSSPPAPILSGFTVTVTCVITTNANTTDANTNQPVQVLQLVSTACNIPDGGACPGQGGSSDYVERVVQITFGGPAIYRRELY